MTPNRLFAKVRQVVRATGVPGRGQATGGALDSTVLDDAVATQDTVTQLIAASAPGGPRGCPARAEVGRRASCTGHEPMVIRASPKNRLGRIRRPGPCLVDALVTDALRLLEHLPEQEPGGKAADAGPGCWRWSPGQDVEPAEDSDGIRWAVGGSPRRTGAGPGGVGGRS